ncbi:hypothetical protein VPHD518_0033 [Vibrio phage D518]
MLKLQDEKVFSNSDIKDFTVPPRPADKRGFVYIVLDSVFPDEFKMGITINVHKRLQQYNSDKPRKTAKVHFVSVMFEDADMVETKILEAMYDRTPPTTMSREWFPIQYLDEAVFLVEEAERNFTNG